MAERILLKTTIPTTDDDWHVGRFSLVAEHLRSLSDGHGERLYDVLAADRTEAPDGDDAELKAAAAGAFDQVWLIAVDDVGALTDGDVRNLEAFRAQGGGLYITRDHQDLGSCIAKLGALGRTQHFQSVNPEEDEGRRVCDDVETSTITWPNYHSGANGDLQPVEAADHPLMRRPDGSRIERLPAHPHEGAVGAPRELAGVATVVATGRSTRTGNRFNLAVAVEEDGKGRGVADSSFHHIADYNWDTKAGCPSFVEEAPGDEVHRDAAALDDTRTYVANVAAWLARRI
ncbi:hypothetical protein SCH01S_20_00070 [Sphingomonas changbaiensis NBRC 104936]|uniref:ThuA-like domain-containing protein n=1 Tax=Sphingomonas changbaiensis NBRC 104936 TaxID=1219043 RepID=A0A0E9MNU3_9SPHN|nr:hypothetical protein [Sphingomonas changbaiensis]GAO38800.1 hypothetical protein SCH01S_20_00070 [Sphingomonas changbaiensis NBRC 104936]